MGYYAQKYKCKLLILNTLYCGYFSILTNILGQFLNGIDPRRKTMYRCEATSIEGFIQQLAVSYVGNGYWFYVAGSVPEGKDPKTVDAKLIEKYQINVSKWTRARRKRQGLASVQYLRFGRFFVLLASAGEHPFFFEELSIRDVRRFPIRFAGYSVSYRKGRDGKSHASVRIDVVEFKWIKDRFLDMALRTSVRVMAGRFSGLGFAAYAPVRNQYRQLLRAVNKKRSLAGLEGVPFSILRLHRHSVLPFGGSCIKTIPIPS